MFSSEAPCLSRPQNTSSPTFQTPFWRTEVPVCPVATDVPAAVRSYFTLALVAEVSETELTFEDTDCASGLAENALIADANCAPFSSNRTRLAFGVAGLKKASQLAVICATADPPAGALEDDAVAADVVAAGAEVAVELELEPLLEQAVIARANTRPRAGARYNRCTRE
jgi:hypothetical protein